MRIYVGPFISSMERQSRLRSLFQNFYGIGLPDKEANVQQDKTNIDGPAYDPHEDFLRIVKTEQLSTIENRFHVVQAGLLSLTVFSDLTTLFHSSF